MKDKNDINEAREWWKLYLGIALAVFGMSVVVYSLIVDPTGAIHATAVTLFGTVLTWIGAMFGIDVSAKVKIHKQELEHDVQTQELRDRMIRFRASRRIGLQDECEFQDDSLG